MNQNEVVVVTGASAGVGRAAARAFAHRGYSVALLARPSSRLDAAADELRSMGTNTLAVALDVADAAAVDAAADRIERALGPMAVWVNNAMTSVFAPAWETTPEEFRRVTEVTYLGYVHGTLAALRHMRPRNRGVIVQVGSALAYRAIPAQSSYCAAKFAIRGFTDSVRCELMNERSRVHITMVQMPALNTPQFSWVRTRLPHKPQPVPPVFQPEVAANAIVHAAEHTRRETYVGASTAAAIVANKIAPSLLDRYLARTGIESQQYDGAVPPGRADNLWEPVGADFGAHGEFDSLARPRSWQWWASKHRRGIAATLALVGAGLLLARRT